MKSYMPRVVGNPKKPNNHWPSMAALLAGFVVLSGLGGCSNTTGQAFSEKAAGGIVIGKTTKTGVTASLGQPYRQVMRSDGSEVWTYLHRRDEDNLALIKLAPVPVVGQIVGKMSKVKINQKTLEVSFSDSIVSSCKLTLFEGEGNGGAPGAQAALGRGKVRELDCGRR